MKLYGAQLPRPLVEANVETTFLLVQTHIQTRKNCGTKKGQFETAVTAQTAVPAKSSKRLTPKQPLRIDLPVLINTELNKVVWKFGY